MTLARLTDLIKPAAATGSGVGAFNVFSIEHAEAHVAGAEQAAAPVVLQISQNAVKYHGALEPIALATLAIGRAASVPVVVHLDHATDDALVDEALAITAAEQAAGRDGFGSVMYDASIREYRDNLSATADVVRRCRAVGVDVEAELGEVGGKDGVHAPGARTDPDDAKAFVAETRVDALAVAVGSSHAMTTRTAALDLELIATLHAAVGVPLVLHGSSGVPDDEIARAVAAGITKVNIATHLNVVFTDVVRSLLTDNPDLVDSRKYLGPAREAVAAEVARLLGVLRP
jgi:fructose-bisphosphate aldolase class II